MASEVNEAWGIVFIMFSGRCTRVVGHFDFAVRFVGNVGSRQCNFAVSSMVIGAEIEIESH